MKKSAHLLLHRIRETTQTILRNEMTVVIRDLFTAQKSEINNLLVQHLRQQQSITPKLPAVASRTTTPLPPTAPAVPSVNPTPSPDLKQQQVLKLARAAQYNQAFEMALSASDLNLVLYLCENIRPADLFSIQPCPLQIPVLLSLIQQLAANLTTHQELKLRLVSKSTVILSKVAFVRFQLSLRGLTLLGSFASEYSRLSLQCAGRFEQETSQLHSRQPFHEHDETFPSLVHGKSKSRAKDSSITRHTQPSSRLACIEIIVRFFSFRLVVREYSL